MSATPGKGMSRPASKKLTVVQGFNLSSSTKKTKPAAAEERPKFKPLPFNKAIFESAPALKAALKPCTVAVSPTLATATRYGPPMDLL